MPRGPSRSCFLFLISATATTEFYTLSLHDALPISRRGLVENIERAAGRALAQLLGKLDTLRLAAGERGGLLADVDIDRKSTRLNSSHEWISYAVFCLKKKNRQTTIHTQPIPPR